MNYERLETARDYLLEVLQPLWEERGAAKFDMSDWFSSKESDNEFDAILKRGYITPTCGTAGCFGGWLPTIFPGKFKIIRDRWGNQLL